MLKQTVKPGMFVPDLDDLGPLTELSMQTPVQWRVLENSDGTISFVGLTADGQPVVVDEAL